MPNRGTILAQSALGPILTPTTTGLFPLAIWSSFTAIRTRVREYYILLLLLQVGLLGVFCARDLLLFYVFFEFTLIPLFFLIGIWGGPMRKNSGMSVNSNKSGSARFSKGNPVAGSIRVPSN